MINKNKLIPFFRYIKAHKLLKPFLAGRGTILSFHRISSDKYERQRISTMSNMEVSTDLLEHIIQYLIHSGYQFLSLDGVYSRLINGFDSSEKPFVSFTFDDGYLDNYELAYPILKKYEIPMTIHLTTSFPDRETTLWWYKLEDMVLNSDSIDFEINNKKYSFPTNTLEEKEKSYLDICNFIFLSTQETFEKIRVRLFDNYVFTKDYMSLLMSWEDVRKISLDPLVTIGAHTINHYNLKKLSPSALQHEIIKSKERIEEKIGKNVDFFAYPFGSKNTTGPREFEAAATAGFKMAMTTRGGNIFTEHKEHLHCLPRISVSWESLEDIEIETRLSGLFPFIRNRFNPIVTN